MSFESAFEPIFSKKRQGLNEEQFKMQLLLKMNQGFWKKPSILHWHRKISAKS